MKHCLVVDDSQVIRKVARRIFESLGFETSEAEDAPAALAHCKAEMPDAILFDADLPNGSGVEFLRDLRRTPGGRAPVVFYLMTENDVPHIKEALNAGATDFLMKPIDRDQVEAKIAQVGLDPEPDAASA